MRSPARERPTTASLVLWALFLCSACDGQDSTGDDEGATGDGEEGATGNEEAETTETETEEGEGGATGDPQVPPTGDTNLRTWLAAEHYRSWASESAIHSSAGPHFGNVRTWLNSAAVAGLEMAAGEFATGAATVKELYGSGDERRGWSVSVRTAAGSGEAGWYWYEVYDGGTIAADHGLSLCLDCHAAGQDYVLTPYPLQ